MISRNRPGVLLLYTTGRTFTSAWRLIAEENILLPDVLITDVGTEIRMSPRYEQDRDWAEIVSLNWDPVAITAIVESSGVLKRQEICPQFRLAYFIEKSVFADTVLQIRHLIEQAHLPVRIVPSMGHIIDIIPRGAGKGEAIHHVREFYGVDKTNVYVCGDSGNDLSMFSQGFKGIVVGNARDELTGALEHGTADVYFSKGRYASGILEGLQHYGLV